MFRMAFLALLSMIFASFPSAARAQQPKEHDTEHWEYKAVSLGGDEVEATKKLSALAAEGWQYVGPVGNGLTAFKRHPASLGQFADLGIKLVRIKKGSFRMGSPDTDPDTWVKPQHEVELTRDFLLAAHPITRGQFRKFTEDVKYKTEAEKDGEGGYGYDPDTDKWKQDPKYTWKNPGFTQTDDHPVVHVSWHDALAFCKWLSKKSGKAVGLPTEAQWELACRAGTTTRYFTGDGPDSLEGHANVRDQSFKKKFGWKSFFAFEDGYAFTSPIGSFKANPWGLYDMTGNVWQWCQDYHDAGYYKVSPKKDPAGPEVGHYRVLRGGSWVDTAVLCRCACRAALAPSYRGDRIGFRICVALDEK